MGTIRIEFFGIPRLRAGVPRATVQADKLSEVIERLTERFPDLAAACFRNGAIGPGYVVNIDGDHFVQQEDIPLMTGQTVLILSADAGG